MISKSQDSFSKMYELSKKAVASDENAKIGVVSDIFLKEIPADELKFSSNNILKEKNNIDYADGEIIRYVTTEYSVLLGEKGKLQIGCYNSEMFLFRDGELSIQIELCGDNRKIEPVLAFTMKETQDTYILFNLISNDFGKQSVAKADGVVESYGSVLLMKISVDDEFGFIYNTVEEVNPYFSCLIYDDELNPVVLFFNPKVQVENKKLPKKFRDLKSYVKSKDDLPSTVSKNNMLPALSAVEPTNGKILKLGFGACEKYLITKMKVSIGVGDSGLNVLEETD